MNRYEYVRGLVPCDIGISPPPIIPQTQTKPFKGECAETYRVGFIYDPENENIFVGKSSARLGYRFSSVIAVYHPQGVGIYEMKLYSWIFGKGIYAKLNHRLSIKPYQDSEGFYFKGDHKDFELVCTSEIYQIFDVVGGHNRSLWEIEDYNKKLLAEVKPLLDSRYQLLNM